MRGQRKKQSSMLMVPKDHPVHRIKKLADDALRDLSPTFDAMYASGWGRWVVLASGSFAAGS